MSTRTPSSTSSNGEWFLDYGARDHMTNRRDWFVNYEDLDEPIPVRMFNGTHIDAVGCGDINILTFNKTSWVEKHLESVLFVPKIHLDLLSQSTVLDKGFVAGFGQERVRFIEEWRSGCSWRTVQAVIQDAFSSSAAARKFRFISLQCSKAANAIAAVAREDGTPKHNAGKALSHEPEHSIRRCQPSGMRRLHRWQAAQITVPGQSEQVNRASAALVHTDVCRPMQEQSIGGARYFV